MQRPRRFPGHTRSIFIIIGDFLILIPLSVVTITIAFRGMHHAASPARAAPACAQEDKVLI